MKKQQSYQALVKALEHKQQLEKDLIELENKGHHLSISFDRSRHIIPEIKNAVLGLRAKYESTDSIYDKQNLELELEKLDRAEAKSNHDQEQFEAWEVEVNALKKELYSLSSECDFSQILEHQKAINAEQLEQQKYQDLINKQQQTIANANQKTDLVTPLLQKREELLVEIALGNDRNEELEQLNANIDNLQAEENANAASNQKIIAHTNQTIAGLQKRLTVIQDRLKTLNNLTPRIIDQLLVNQAEAVAHDYQQTAAELINQLTKLTALDSLIAEIGQRANSGMFPKDWWNLLIPKLKIMSPDKTLNGDKNHFVNIRNQRPPAIESIEAIKVELIEQGIQWPE